MTEKVNPARKAFLVTLSDGYYGQVIENRTYIIMPKQTLFWTNRQGNNGSGQLRLVVTYQDHAKNSTKKAVAMTKSGRTRTDDQARPSAAC